ncbi:bifunctional nuclease family protein [Treponema sp. TIM-1]|uniref:bifunctional nuclease domain-containing protein n=1 Tax=Treponema sp. TIM-1 TaxID=2898417 RepID=UPI00397F3EC2
MQKMTEVEIWTIIRTDQGNAVLLRPLGSDISVPIFIGPLESQAILIGLGGMTFPRPLTHDLLLDLMHRVGLRLIRTEIYDIKENVFLARLYLDRDHPGNPLILDSRPSDAIALALRCKCPILVSKKVVTAAGVPADIFINAPGENPAFPSEARFEERSEISEKSLRRLALQTELEGAVANEEYERAAKLRDALILLDNETDIEDR